MEKQGRGQLTARVKVKALNLLGREITVRELRLMPYVSHCLLNNRYIDQRHVNDEERALLDAWLDAGWLQGSQHNLGITREFWMQMSEILYLAYVDLRD